MKQATSDISQHRLGLDPTVALGLAGAIVFFLISGLVAYLNLRALEEGNERIVQTHVAILALDQLFSQVQDAETGQRGFLLTNDEAYLVPYDVALQAIPPQLDKIAQSTSGNAGQAGRLAALRQHVAARLSALGDAIDLRRTRDLASAIALLNTDRGKREMDAIRAQIAVMVEGEGDVRRQRLAEMSGAQQRALISTLLAGALGIALTATIGFLVRRATLARRREDWLQSGQVALTSAMMGDQPVEQLGNNILEFLSEYVGAVAGAVFTGGGDNYQLASVYGVRDKDTIPASFKLREGLLGQAAAEDKSMMIDEVPDGYLAFGSAFGADKPRYLVILPGSVDGAVNSVIELGFLRPVDQNVMTLLDECTTRRAGPAVGGPTR